MINPGRQLFLRLDQRIFVFFPAALFIISVCLGLGAAEFQQKAQDEIKSVMGKDIESSWQTYTITPGTREKIEKIVGSPFVADTVEFCKISANNEVKGYAILDHAKGKVHTFTFLVLFDPQGSIILVRVVKYREEHGSEIKDKKWLKQFNEKNSASSYVFGKDIDGISGATISSRSITQGIWRLSNLITYIMESTGNHE